MAERELRNKAIKDLDQEVYPLAIKRVKEYYQEIYESEWEEYWKKEDPLSLIEKKKACGLIFSIWLAILK